MCALPGEQERSVASHLVSKRLTRPRRQGYADVPSALRNTPEGHLMALRAAIQAPAPPPTSAHPGPSREHSSNPRPEAEEGAQPPAIRQRTREEIDL